jgi:hypothetical protein
MSPAALSMGCIVGSLKHEKIVLRYFVHRRSRMHYVIRRWNQMQKHMFGVTCSNMLFMVSATDPLRALKIVHRRFTPWTQQNQLHCPLIVPNAKTQVQCNVSHCTFSSNHTRPIRAGKILSQHCMPWTHPNGLHDPHIVPDAKIQVRCNVSWCTFYGIRSEPTQAWKIVHRHLRPQMPKMHYVTYISHQMQKHKFNVTCPTALFLRSTPSRPEHEK